MPLDIDAIRRDTPGTDHVLHFNNAGASLPPRPVVEAQREYLDREAHIGGYETADERQQTLAQVYASIARFLNAAPEEIALTDNATRAWDMAFYSLAELFEPEDRILTSQASYASNYLAFLQVARKKELDIVVIPQDDHGQVDLDALQYHIDDRVQLVALTHVPTNNGLVNPAREVGQIAADAEIPYLLDACQSAGQLPLDVAELKCTMLSATGRKYLRGPRGTGFLYVRQDWIERLDPPFIDLRAATWTSADSYALRNDARRFETWEANMAARVGLGQAVAYAMDLGIKEIWNRVRQLAQQLRMRLNEISGVLLHDRGRIKGGIVAFSHKDHASADLSRRLRDLDINTSLSTPSATLLDAQARDLPDIVRASLHYYNTENEIDRFCTALERLITQYPVSQSRFTS